MRMSGEDCETDELIPPTYLILPGVNHNCLLEISKQQVISAGNQGDSLGCSLGLAIYLLVKLGQSINT